MQPIHLFTSITANYLPKARVLANSIKRVHPEAQFHLVLSDIIPSTLVLKNEPFDSIITIEELSIPNLKSWIFKHSIVEMCTGVKPFAFQEIFRRYNCEKIIYLDPDIVIFNRLDCIAEKLDDHSIVLTPHQTEPENYNEAVIDNEICSLKHGVYNLGFLAIRNSEEGRRFLEWWLKRCFDFCYDDIPGGIFTDQRWIDLAPAFFEDLYILREPNYNVATWNLTNRMATGSLKEGIFINGRPLCFYHFSGFDSGAQEIMLKKYGASSPVLFELRKWYIAQCEYMGQYEFGKISCFYSYFDNSELITKQQRLLYRQRLDLQQAYPNPFATVDVHKSYFNWYENHGQYEFVKAPKNTLDLNQILVQIQSELEQAQDLIRGMESSKFWKLRTAWFQLKALPNSIIKKLKQIREKTKRASQLWQSQYSLFIQKLRKQIKSQKEQISVQVKLSSLPINISLKVNSPQPNLIYTGLILLSGEICSEKTDVVGAMLDISLNENEWTSISLNKTSFEAVINSFLLPNGKNTLYVHLINSLGEKLARTQINFLVDNTGSLAKSVSDCLQKSSASKIVIQGCLDSSNFPYADCKIVPWFDQPDALDHIPQVIKKYDLSEELAQHFENFVNLGYINLDSYIPLELVSEINSDIDRLIANGSISYVDQSGERIEHLFQKSKAVHQLWTYPSILKILSALFDDIAVPCQTLNFIHGSQQEVHQDTIHLTPFPEGYMCGVWVALEDINPDAGPLFVYPKSHRLPILYAKTVGIDKQTNYWNQHLIDEYSQKYLPTLKSNLIKFKLEPMIYTPKAGSVFIWHANLAHGGNPRKVSNLTRKSMVSHYFARGSIAFYDTTGTIGYKHELR
jgi:ectoine hydroxylase-related dioxygenase (phytanoyl-CoA dioxygenase family)/lipopolysaccharide biosynthesis glycosyltransferase